VLLLAFNRFIFWRACAK